MIGDIVAADVSRLTSKRKAFTTGLLHYARAVNDCLATRRSSRAKLRANSCAPSFAAFSFLPNVAVVNGCEFEGAFWSP